MSIQYLLLGFEPTTFSTWSPSITTRPGLAQIYQCRRNGKPSIGPAAPSFEISPTGAGEINHGGGLQVLSPMGRCRECCNDHLYAGWRRNETRGMFHKTCFICTNLCPFGC